MCDLMLVFRAVYKCFFVAWKYAVFCHIVMLLIGISVALFVELSFNIFDLSYNVLLFKYIMIYVYAEQKVGFQDVAFLSSQALFPSHFLRL